MLKVDICDGKYTVIQNDQGNLFALRYGKEWRNCCGDNLIYSLAAEIENLRNENQELRNKINVMFV